VGACRKILIRCNICGVVLVLTDIQAVPISFRSLRSWVLKFTRDVTNLMAVGDIALVWTIWESSLDYRFPIFTLVTFLGWFAEKRPTEQTVSGLTVVVSDGK
jgi:hypothetical protein